jgi:hypothetical protein
MPQKGSISLKTLTKCGKYIGIVILICNSTTSF